MTDLLTLPWEGLDDRAALATKMAAWAARGIIERRYEAGEMLTEADLAAALDASRTPAREAMLQLERWRLVRLAPKKGAVVTAITTAERRDLLAVRAMFEINAVETFGSDADELEALATDLQHLLGLQRAALAANDSLAFASTDYAMHARIIRSGGNAVIEEVLHNLGPRFARLTYHAIMEQPAALVTILDEHEQLVEYAGTGDAAAFAALVRQHIEAVHFPQGAAR